MVFIDDWVKHDHRREHRDEPRPPEVQLACERALNLRVGFFQPEAAIGKENTGGWLP